MGRTTVIVSLAAVLCLAGCSGPSPAPDAAKAKGPGAQEATKPKDPAFKDGFESGNTKQWQERQETPAPAPRKTAPLGK